MTVFNNKTLACDVFFLLHVLYSKVAKNIPLIHVVTNVRDRTGSAPSHGPFSTSKQLPRKQHVYSVGQQNDILDENRHASKARFVLNPEFSMRYKLSTNYCKINTVRISLCENNE